MILVWCRCGRAQCSLYRAISEWISGSVNMTRIYIRYGNFRRQKSSKEAYMLCLQTHDLPDQQSILDE